MALSTAGLPYFEGWRPLVDDEVTQAGDFFSVYDAGAWQEPSVKCHVFGYSWNMWTTAHAYRPTGPSSKVAVRVKATPLPLP